MWDNFAPPWLRRAVFAALDEAFAPTCGPKRPPAICWRSGVGRIRKARRHTLEHAWAFDRNAVLREIGPAGNARRKRSQSREAAKPYRAPTYMPSAKMRSAGRLSAGSDLVLDLACPKYARLDDNHVRPRARPCVSFTLGPAV